MKRPALQNKRVAVLRMAFRARKFFGTFKKRVPDLYLNARARIAPTSLKQLIVFPSYRKLAINNSCILFSHFKDKKYWGCSGNYIIQ